MTILAVTTWEGSVAGLQTLEAGSKQSAPLHESMGAKIQNFGARALAVILSAPTILSSSTPMKLMGNSAMP